MTSNSDTAQPNSLPEREPVSAIKESATGTAEQSDVGSEVALYLRPAGQLVGIGVVPGLAGGLFVFSKVEPQWQEQKTTYNVYENDNGTLVYKFKGEENPVGEWRRKPGTRSFNLLCDRAERQRVRRSMFFNFGCNHPECDDDGLRPDGSRQYSDCPRQRRGTCGSCPVGSNGILLRAISEVWQCEFLRA